MKKKFIQNDIYRRRIKKAQEWDDTAKFRSDIHSDIYSFIEGMRYQKDLLRDKYETIIYPEKKPTTYEDDILVNLNLKKEIIKDLCI